MLPLKFLFYYLFLSGPFNRLYRMTALHHHGPMRRLETSSAFLQSTWWTRPLGRDDIIDALLLELPVRRFTIVGPGGIAKTTVALALARCFWKVIATECGSSNSPSCETPTACRAQSQRRRDSCGGRHKGSTCRENRDVERKRLAQGRWLVSKREAAKLLFNEVEILARILRDDAR